MKVTFVDSMDEVLRIALAGDLDALSARAAAQPPLDVSSDLESDETRAQ
jgi:hypothetical protein